MSGGSIYIDPDSVSSVSSQIGITAEQLDSLRRSIVPQVNEVIAMSYPSIQEMPNVAYPLDATQGNIEAFNYRAQLLAEDLRTTSLKLKQIAEAGRTMNDILLRQVTVFDATGQGGNHNISWNVPEPLKTIMNMTGSGIAFSSLLIHILLRTGVFKDVKALQKYTKYAKYIDETPWVGMVLTIVGSEIDFATGDNHDLKTAYSDAIGGVIGAGVAEIPGVDIALLAFAGMQLAGTGLGSVQGWLANQYSGNPAIQQSLDVTSKGLIDASQRANPGKVFDDMGALTLDAGSALLGFGGGADVGKDSRTLLNDTGSTLYSIPEFVTNTDFMVQQDTNLGLNALVQNSPLPASWKSTYQTSTFNNIKTMGQYANDVNNVPAQMGKLTDAAQHIISTNSQQFYNQEVVVQ